MLAFMRSAEVLAMRLLNTKMETPVTEVILIRCRDQYSQLLQTPDKMLKPSTFEYATSAFIAQMSMTEEQWLDFIGECYMLVPRHLSEGKAKCSRNDPRRGFAFIVCSDIPKALPLSGGFTKMPNIQWQDERSSMPSGTRTKPAPTLLRLGLPPRPFDNHLIFIGHPSYFTRLCIIGGEGVMTLDPELLASYAHLESITLNGFHHVRHIPNAFIASCPKLRVVKLIGFTAVESIGESFLKGCPKLQSVQIDGLRGVRSIRSFFLMNSHAFQGPLPHFPSLQSVGDMFLADSGMQMVDFSPLQSLETIGAYCLGKSSAVSVDMSQCFSLKSIGSSFCTDCKRLTSLDLSGLVSVERVGSAFLRRCVVPEIDLSSLSSATTIGDYFMADTRSNVSGWEGLSEVRQIGSQFLARSTLIKGCDTIDLSDWSALESVGPSFFEGCTNLRFLNCVGWSSLRSVGRDFCSDISSLQGIDLSGWSSAGQIDDKFLAGCPALKHISHNGCSSFVVRHAAAFALK